MGMIVLVPCLYLVLSSSELGNNAQVLVHLSASLRKREDEDGEESWPPRPFIISA